MKKAIPTILLLVLLACSREQKPHSIGDPERGKAAIEKYGCTACHKIPGISGPKGAVGPALDHIASRPTIAGKFENTPQTMVRWLQDPTALDKETSMPALGVTAADSRDITAYLFTLK